MTKRAKRGQGSVRQLPSGSYEAAISLGNVRYSASYEKESDALLQLTRWKNEHADGRLGRAKPAPPAPALTFGVLALLMREHKVITRKWKEGTARWFDEHNKGVVEPAFGRRPVDAITSQELELWLKDQIGRPAKLRNGQRSTEARVSVQTVKHYETLLSMVFRFGVRTGRLAVNPMAAVDRLKVPDDEQDAEERCLTADELRALLGVLATAIDDAGARLAGAAKSNREERADLVALARRDLAFFHALALTGLRRAEIFRMCWDWLDLPAGVMKVRKQKRGRPVDFPLAPGLVRALERLERGKPDHLVFPGFKRAGGARRLAARDPHHKMHTMRGSLIEALKAAKVNHADVGLHSFRRAFLSLVEEVVGERYSIVRALARHTRKGRDITARYLFPRWEELADAVRRVEEHILGRPAAAPAEPAELPAVNVIQFPLVKAG